MPSGSVDLTAKRRKDIEPSLEQWSVNPVSRWQDGNAGQKLSSLLFDLVASENERARKYTASHEKGGDDAWKEIGATPSPLQRINNLLLAGGMTVTLSIGAGDEIIASHDGEDHFSMAKLSDGERNAIILAATVLTVKPGTLLLVDEPERHLHRAIIEPLIAALFEVRADCRFVVSTHELSLPTTGVSSKVLLPRGCEWVGDTAGSWAIDVLEPDADLPDDLRRAILGSRAKILFVEGEHKSLDRPIYSALFPCVSVVPKGSCIDVMRAVKGLRGAEGLHWIEAYGLIDRDHRSDEEVKTMEAEGIFALQVHSVEALYFSEPMRTALAEVQAETVGQNPRALLKDATNAALSALADSKVLSEQCAKRCQRRVHDEIVQQVPQWKDIESGITKEVVAQVGSTFEDEKIRYKGLLDSEDLDGLIARYPVRESPALNQLSNKLLFRTKALYEQAALVRLKSDAALKAKVLKLLGALAEKLSTSPASLPRKPTSRPSPT